MKRTILFLVLFSLFFSSCKDRSEPSDVAGRFLSAYLDCRFPDAERIASPEVLEQMRWRVSQLTQAEVELLSENEPLVEVEKTEVYDDSCLVVLNASNALQLDSIGLPGYIGEQRFFVTLQKDKGGSWKVTSLR